VSQSVPGSSEPELDNAANLRDSDHRRGHEHDRDPDHDHARSRDDESEPEEKDEEAEKSRFSFLKELPVLVVLAFLLALLIKTFLIQAFFIPSASMEPTLVPGDRVLVNKVDYHFHPPRRGDVIVFENPKPAAQPHRNPVAGFVHWLSQGIGISQPADEDFIKRVIGLPGDTVKVAADGTYVNGVKLDEPYVFGDGPGPLGTWHVPADSVFVMGDNRTNSNDSRVSLGYIPYDRILGKAFVKIWPPSRIGGL
jgi:signal peptidase I